LKILIKKVKSQNLPWEKKSKIGAKSKEKRIDKSTFSKSRKKEANKSTFSDEIEAEVTNLKKSVEDIYDFEDNSNLKVEAIPENSYANISNNLDVLLFQSETIEGSNIISEDEIDDLSNDDRDELQSLSRHKEGSNIEYSLDYGESMSTSSLISGESKSTMRSIDAFIILQIANGSFVLNNEFENIVKLRRSLIESSIPLEISNAEGLDNQAKTSVWVTIIAIAFLEKTFWDLSDEWSLLADKSQKYIRKSLPGVNIKQLIESAKYIIPN